MTSREIDRPRLLVSVRTLEEACAAVAGGASIIDIKDPARGPLGAAVESWSEIVNGLEGRVSVSAAMGELGEWAERRVPDVPPRITWLKFGLAGERRTDWPSAWARLGQRLPPHVRRVLVAYADWKRCDAPPLQDVADVALVVADGLLIDTHTKDGRTLWDFVTLEELVNLAAHCRQSARTLAVAGSLTSETISRAVSSRCDWVAVRGAACDGGREGNVRADLVRRLRRRLESAYDR